MTLDLLWTILLYILVSLAVLFVVVIWVVILAATWFTVLKFLTQYQESKKQLVQREKAKAMSSELEGPNDYLST